MIFRIVPSRAKGLVPFFSMMAFIRHCIQRRVERDGLTWQLKACLTAKTLRPSLKQFGCHILVSTGILARGLGMPPAWLTGGDRGLANRLF